MHRYWSINRNDNGSLPLTTFALDRALLEWGLIDEAGKKVAFYLEVGTKHSFHPPTLHCLLPFPITWNSTLAV